MISLNFFDLIQKASLPGIWSKGVALARANSVILDSQSPEEVLLRVRGTDHPVSRKVSLWPEDEDWYCDCENPNKVCAHTAASAIALKTGKLELQSTTPQKSKSAQIHYRFSRSDIKGNIKIEEGKYLAFERWIVQGNGKEEILLDSLVSFVGGVTSGRVSSLPVAATQADFAVDSALESQKQGVLSAATFVRLFKVLSECPSVFLDQSPIKTSAQPFKLQVEVLDERSGFRLKAIENENQMEYFKNGAALFGNILRAIEVPSLTPEEKEIFSPNGRLFRSPPEIYSLVAEILPRLEKKVVLEIRTQKLPELRRVPPTLVLQTEKTNSETLSILPQIIYPNPISESGRPILIEPDPPAEKKWIRKLQDELQLSPGQWTRFEGEAAVRFTQRLPREWKTTGDGIQSFAIHAELVPQFTLEVLSNESRCEISFESRGQSGNEKADPAKVFKAWRENQSYVPLLSGGWAKLPENWLNQYGSRIQALLAAKSNQGTVPSYLIPELTGICDELHQPYSESVKALKNLLMEKEKIPDVALPADLRADLRPYQKQGVNWLCFLRQAKMGALLADDMGLGKTLQALCAMQGRTLIVVPTSVIHSWADQITLFRPEVTFSSYYGSQRKLGPNDTITLTTYAIFRLDSKALIKEKWDTVILDEAQTIKNPDSQISRAAHQLRADFRIALSGTPIENRLDDLWSQFQFLNPGLLGKLDDFKEEFANPISQGGPSQSARQSELLHQRIKPFILRRLKKEVAPDLPEKTEIVLYCELSPKERETYETVMASARKEVLEKLDENLSLFTALELLLRLRQACCHPGLLPGDQKTASSSKTELLIQTLENSLGYGHRALIFSQWTSYLDLIEPHLKKADISFSRIDGATQNRHEIVQQFQAPSGPSVMLISLKAGGIGLTLTAADHIFLMDPWWNPSVENQAADRAHRIGQKNPVLVHRLVAQDTLEDRIMQLQKSKVQLAEAVLQNTGNTFQMTREDLLKLLAP